MAIKDVNVPHVLKRLGIETKRQGRELWARCPFHEERSPSWRMRDEPSNDNHGVWQCFGSCPEGRRSGSIVSLVQTLLDLNTREDAWKWIKDKGGDLTAKPISRIEIICTEQRRQFALPHGVVLTPVSQWVSSARRYLIEDRCIPVEQAERWGFGYAVEGRLAGRIVIPVRDSNNRVLSYTARTYLGNPRVYLMPRSEENADKACVFGECMWPPLSERKIVVIAEGAFDALAIERITALPVAAIFGSELLPGHVARLSTFREMVIASDPDDAGNKLADVLRRQLGRWIRLRRARLPMGEDADALARTNPERLRSVMRDAT